MNLTVSGPGRIAALDIARGFAILAVVASHAQLLWAPAAPWIYEFYVPLFFVLAGYLGLGQPSAPAAGTDGAAVFYRLRRAVRDLVRALSPAGRGHRPDRPGGVQRRCTAGSTTPANPVLVNCLWAGQLWFLTLLVTATALFYLVRRLLGPPWRLAVALVVLLAAAPAAARHPRCCAWCLDTAPMGRRLHADGPCPGRAGFCPAAVPATAVCPLLIVCAVAYIQRHDTYDLNLRGLRPVRGLAGDGILFSGRDRRHRAVHCGLRPAGQGAAGEHCIAGRGTPQHGDLLLAYLRAVGAGFGMMRLPDAFPADCPCRPAAFRPAALVRNTASLCSYLFLLCKEEPKTTLNNNPP